MKWFNINKSKEAEGKYQYRIEISKRLAASEYVYNDVDHNTARETIRENSKISAKDILSYYELKKHKP
jgi:hypothetical protein